MSCTMIERMEGFKGSEREQERGGGKGEREHNIAGVASIKAGQEEALLMRTSWATPSPMYTIIKLQHT